MIRASSVGIQPGRRPASLGLAAMLAGTVAAGVPTAVTAAAVGRSDAWAGLATTPLVSDQTIAQNVLLIAHDPLFPDKGNQPLWYPPTTRLLGSDGTARFYRQIDGWIAIRGYIASTSGSAWSLSRIATARTSWSPHRSTRRRG